MQNVKNDMPLVVFLTAVPGADRKRTPSLYQYRMVYRNLASEPGCRMVWEVTGGRMDYQIAIERKEDGRLQYHCTCADAVYRGEKEPNHSCKHIRGLMECSSVFSPETITSAA